jgi:hypothetical protein
MYFVSIVHAANLSAGTLQGRKEMLGPVLQIRIRIRMFLGFLDPECSRIRIFHHQAKIVRKTLIPIAL